MAAPARPHPFDQLLELERRSQAAPAPGSAGAGVGALGLRLGGTQLLFDLRETGEIVPLPRLTQVPGAQAWLLGIMSLRGRITTVIDLLDFLTGRRSVVGPRSRLVVVPGEAWSYALLVDEIVGMRPSGPANRRPLPAVDPALRPYLRDAYEVDGSLWFAFDLGRLLADPRFMAAAL